MKTSTKIIFLLLSIGVLFSCEPQDETTPDPAAEKAAIRAVHEQETAGINGNDLKSYLATLDKEVVMFPEQGAMVAGKKAVTKWYKDMSNADFELKTFSGDIILAGDYAIENYSWDFSGTLAGEEEPMTDSGKGVHIYRKQEDGSWKIYWDIWNSDNPPPSPGMIPPEEPMDTTEAGS